MAEYRDPTPISPREPEYDKTKVSKEVANYSKQVREKIKGHDVREALARNSEIADIKAEDAVATSYDTKTRQDDIENRFDDQIAGNTDIDEVIDARRPEGEEAYPTLRRRLDAEHQEVTAQLAQTSYFLMWEGAKGDGITDDSAFLESLIARATSNSMVDLSGRSFLIKDTDVSLNKSLKFRNGTLLLENSTLIVKAGVNDTYFENVTFDGVDKLSDGIIVNYPSKEHRFINCVFKNNNRGLRTQANMDTQQDLYVQNCSFNNNVIGLSLKDLKRVTILGNKFYENELGFHSETEDYQGIGMIFSDNYLNGNGRGAKIEGGLYDSLISNNIFDHNNFKTLDGEGYGLEISVPQGRYIRNISVDNNITRNNGEHSIKIIVKGSMDFSSVSNNLSHLDTVSNLLIDYSDGNFTNNQILNNYFNDKYTVIDNGINITKDNSMWSGFSGGNIRGRTTFESSLSLRPREFLFENSEGTIQNHDGSESYPGLYSVENGLNRKVLTTGAVQTSKRPDVNKLKAGYMTFDSTLNKPIWLGLNRIWVDAMGNEV